MKRKFKPVLRGIAVSFACLTKAAVIYESIMKSQHFLLLTAE